ncbi:MAG: DUF167 domain-containing protein [Solirubrobacteraceae bacterium]
MSAARFTIRVRAGSSREAVEVDTHGNVTVRVHAPPVNGRANDSACRLLAGVLGVPHTRVHVLRGERARTKVIEVQGLTQDELDRKLARAAASTSA